MKRQGRTGSLRALLIQMPAIGARPAQSGTLGSQDCRSPRNCGCPGKPPALGAPRTSALAGAPSTAGLPLSVVFNPERGSPPSYSSLLTSTKEHDCARREHELCLSKLCRVFSLYQTHGGTPGTGGQRLTWACSGAGVHSSPRNKTTSLLVGSLCGAAPAACSCAQARRGWGAAPVGPVLTGRGPMGQPDPSATLRPSAQPRAIADP